MRQKNRAFFPLNTPPNKTLLWSHNKSLNGHDYMVSFGLPHNRGGLIVSINKQIAKWQREIKKLSSIPFDAVVVNEENLEVYVKRYVKAVRYYPVKPFVRIIRVEIKEEYLPAGANNYKDYEVCRNWKNQYIVPLEIKYAKEMLQHNGVEIDIEDGNDNWSVNPSVFYSND